MKIRLLTLLFALVAPMLVFGQTITGNGGPLTPPGTTSGVVTYPSTSGTIAGSTLAGGTCSSTGVVIADQAVPAILGYNTEITNITLFDVQHTFAADLDLRLVAPDGTVLTFNLDNGGSTGLDATTDMCFDITATSCADSWTSSGSAAQPENCLLFETSENNCGGLAADWEFVCGNNSGIFGGVQASGVWTLQVTDDAGGDTGSFASFSITFSPLAPPAVDPNGTAIDLVSCCVDICELTGPTVFNFPLEAGECEEAIFYEAPGIGGGPSCKFCGELPEATYVAVGNVTETLGGNGLPTEVVIGEGGTNSYTITAVSPATLFFDYQYVGSTFWDPFSINGPGGSLVTGNAGSVAQPLTPGQSVVAQIASLDGVNDGSTLTLSGIGYFNAADYPCYVLELVDGPAVGDYYPPGSYEANYVATPFVIIGGSPTGDPGSAINYTQTINVLPYNGPVSNALACNDHVNISVDETCSITLNADMFLEGGPYGCYDDYEINIWIYGNEGNQTGNVSGATIDFSALLGVHTYEITDPSTGNSCWGTFTVEDKLAPVLTCNDYTIFCTEGTINSPLVCDALNVSWDVQTNSGGPNAYTTELLCGVIIEDMEVSVNVEFTGGFFSQFEWGSTIVTPSGAEVSIWPAGIGGCGNLNFIADDQGPDGLTCVQFTNGMPTSMITVHEAFGFPYTPLAAANGSSSQGTWTLNLEGALIINDFSVLINGGLCGLAPAAPDQDACGNTSYTYADSEVDNGCDGSVITRTWFATDASGNTSDGCVQTINVVNIGISELLLPPALIELPCGNGTSPDDIVAYFDNPLTTDIPLSATCNLDVVERNEGYPFGFPYYMQRGCDGGKHPQKVDNNVCSIYATYTDQVIPACGVGCNGNVKVIRTWTLLDWCTNETQ